MEEAEQVLGWPLGQIMDTGPEEVLRDTVRAQPALLTMGVACAERLRALGESPDAVLGHSVGEYAALVVADALGFSEAVSLVAQRGQLMADAARAAPGGMIAVIGASQDAIEKVVESCRRLGVLEVSNRNGPSQLVLSGEQAALEAAGTALTERRLGRAVPLPVAAPFHCSLMRPVADEFAEVLAKVSLRAPSCLFINNVTGDTEDDPERIRSRLIEQLYLPVQWQQSIERARVLGVTRFVESGPKSVLTGLVKRIWRGATLVTAEHLLEPTT